MRWLLLLGILVLLACSREMQGDVVADVNGDQLTLSDLRLMIPDFELLDSLQRSILVENWIRETLLAQEAEKNLLHRDPTFRYRVATYQRRLLADKQLESVLKATGRIKQEEVEDYYQANLSSFKRVTDEFFGFHAVVPERDLAYQLVRAIKRNDIDLRQQLLGFHPQETGLFQINNLVPEVKNYLLRRKEAGVYGPLRTDLGYHIIEIKSWYNQGTVLSLEEVWEEIAARLSINVQRDLERALVDSLRSESTIVFNSGHL